MRGKLRRLAEIREIESLQAVFYFMSKKLTEQDFEINAKKLRCEIASVKAVAEIESRGSGFYSNGFPTILFERHVFRKYTQGRYNKSHPHLSGPAGNYGAAGQNQRNKFNEAFALNPTAAMKACSWGRFQIMGFNYAVCGFNSVNEFVDAMKVSEGNQLLAFVNFVINNNLADELRAKNWEKFAKGYNGAGYKKNNYDLKLAAAYRKYAAQKTKKVSAVAPATLPADDQPIEPDNSIETLAVDTPNLDSNEQPPNQITTTTTTTETASEPSPSVVEVIDAPEKEGSTATATKLTIGGFAVPTILATIFGVIKSSIEQGFLSASQVGEIVLNFLQTNTKFFFAGIGLIILGLMLKKAYKQITFFLQMWFAASKDKNTVEIKKQ